MDTSSVGDAQADVTDAKLLADSPLPTAEGLLQDLLWAPVASRPQDVTGPGDRGSPSRVSRWRLAREGPFLAEWPASILAWRRMRFPEYHLSSFGLRGAVG